ncbi:MAG: element excision factor XisH family protein [Nostoc sp. EfeVER01]|uniref:element excision factor XisH family protein n=1 Tax=unclassified Nostoc TaxID=2593658 RepID=UPI002AD3B427|nr:MULTISPECIES: element excision factor XisH family protein [unclassified Nostoc]MDZ7945719.1 element excision factor XisH family protein [Nostoc sp. EfeVER01]MDZ7994226.1 element excision factor XisH family protein [Nostoc sp. EspVER01]
MPKLDIIHNAVKNALIKDGWVITDEPYVIQYRRTTLYADLSAERPIGAERDGQKLVGKMANALLV